MKDKFHERFGIDLGVAEGKRHFVNRVLNFFLEDIMQRTNSLDERQEIERYLCSKLGERFAGLGCLAMTIRTDFDTGLYAFENCLRAVEALHEHPEWKTQTEMGILSILAETEVDIGIRWANGKFLPTGAPVLDAALLCDPLNLLSSSEYKGVSDAFQKGLDHFLHSTKNPNLLADVLTDMYEALEAMAKIVCPNGKDRDLSANREALISNLDLADPYKRMLKEYIEYANKFGRHAGPKGMPKPISSRKEVEAFMYLTGLFIRVALSKNF